MESLHSNIIICITGLTGSGKTTFAQLLKQKLISLNFNASHYTTDFIRENLYTERTDEPNFKTRDFTEDELLRSYNGLYLLIEELLNKTEQQIIITDGTYRYASQRLYLKLIAQRNNAKFVLVKMNTRINTSRERMIKRQAAGGLNGWVDPITYEEVYDQNLVYINNNKNLSDLNKQADSLIKSFNLKFHNLTLSNLSPI